MIFLPCELMVSGGLFPFAEPEIFRQLGVLAERTVGPHGALEDDARLLHGRGDDVRIGALFCDTLVEEIAVGAPRLQGSLHRRCGDGLFEEAQRSLIGLQLPRHEGSRIGSRWPRLLREQESAKPGEQRGRSRIDVGATGLSQ
jgi:hypothetical protein